MAVVLLRLRLAIRRSGRGSWSSNRGLMIIGMWILGVGGGLAVGALVAFLVWLDRGTPAALAVLVSVFVGWLFMPLITPALQDQTVDPARLEMYPLTVREKVSGLLLGGLAAPTTVGTFLAALGVAVSPGIGWAARPVALVGAGVFAVTCVAWSRALQTALARVTASRRGRDAGLVATGLLSLSFYVSTQVLLRDPDLLSATPTQGAGAVLAWTPAGAPLHVALDLDAGSALLPLGRLVVALAWVAAALGVWAWALSRRERGAAHERVRRRRARRGDAQLALTGGLLRVVPRGPAGATAAQHARYLFFRKPRAGQQVLVSLVIGAVFAHTAGGDAGLAFASAMVGAFVAISMGTGLLNYDGRGVELLVIQGAPMRSVLAGKAAVTATVSVVAVTVFVGVESGLGLLESDAAGVVQALLCGLAAALWSAAVGAVVSVAAPFDADGKSSARAGPALFGAGAIFGILITVVTVAAVARALGGLSLMMALGILALSAAGSWWVATRAARRLEARQLHVAQLIVVG